MSLACAQVQNQLFMHLSAQGDVSLHSLTLSPAVCNALANAGEHTKIDWRNRKAKNTDCIQAGRVRSTPATSA